MTLGARFKSLRKASGLTQLQLARLLRVQQPAVSMIESGVTKDLAGPTLEMACKILKTNPTWLNHGRGSPGQIQVATSDSLEIVDLWQLMDENARDFLLTTARALVIKSESKATAANPFPKSKKTPV